MTPTGGRPIQLHPVPADTPRWGSVWKKAVAQYYNRSFSINTHGGTMAYRSNHLDLDPTYRDIYGDRLLRMTYDHRDNDVKMSSYLTDRAEEIARALKPAHMTTARAKAPYSIVPYQTTHNTGGLGLSAWAGWSISGRQTTRTDCQELLRSSRSTCTSMPIISILARRRLLTSIR